MPAGLKIGPYFARKLKKLRVSFANLFVGVNNYKKDSAYLIKIGLTFKSTVVGSRR